MLAQVLQSGALGDGSKEEKPEMFPGKWVDENPESKAMPLCRAADEVQGCELHIAEGAGAVAELELVGGTDGPKPRKIFVLRGFDY